MPRVREPCRGQVSLLPLVRRAAAAEARRVLRPASRDRSGCCEGASCLALSRRRRERSRRSASASGTSTQPRRPCRSRTRRPHGSRRSSRRGRSRGASCSSSCATRCVSSPRTPLRSAACATRSSSSISTAPCRLRRDHPRLDAARRGDRARRDVQRRAAARRPSAGRVSRRRWHALDPHRVEELVASTVRTTSRCTTRLESAPAWMSVLDELKEPRAPARHRHGEAPRHRRPRLRALPIEHLFEVVVGGDETHAAQAASGSRSQLALERLGASPDEAAYVGDSPFDMQAAKAAGLRAIGVAWGRIHAPAALVDADVVIALARRSCSSSSKVTARAEELREPAQPLALRVPRARRPVGRRRDVRPPLRRARRARARASRARHRRLADPARRRAGLRPVPEGAAPGSRWARSRR